MPKVIKTLRLIKVDDAPGRSAIVVRKKKIMATDAIRQIDSRQQYWQRNKGLWVIAFCLCVLTILSLHQVLYQRGFQRILNSAAEQARQELVLQIEILESHLEKYRLLPVLMARHGEKIDIQRPDVSTTWLKQLAYVTGAHDVLILSDSGDLLHSARHDVRHYPELSDTNLVIAPKEARLGRQYLYLDTETQLYGFSSTLIRSTTERYILVFMVDLAQVFESWSLSGTAILAFDDSGAITLASERDWIGRTRADVDRFAQNPDYAMAATDLETMGWHILAYQPIERIFLLRQMWYASALAVLSIVIFFTLFIRRRELQVKAVLRDRLYAAELERQINFRTAELQSANENLTEEVSERRRAEQQLKATQKELIHSAKLATIGQMSTTLSHEYNQPLAAMRTYADNALQFIQRGRTEPVVENLQRIIAQTDRLGDLSKTLMSFARKPDDDFDQVNLSACISEAIMLVQPRLNKSAIQIDNQVAANTLVTGRTVQVSQILVNLLINAIDAIRSHSGMGVEHRIRIRCQSDTKSVCIQIEDSGPGIEHDKLDTIFDPFVTTKGNGQGLGLGLSVVKDIVRDHHGQLTVARSDLGGANFQITLPRWPGSQGDANDTQS